MRIKDVDEVTEVFNLWATRYARDPEDFNLSILDSEGRPMKDYGEACSRYFFKLLSEVQSN